MLVFTTKALAAAGLDFQMARALLAPGESELLVHVRQELDGPPVRHGDLDHATPHAGSHRETSLGIQSDATDYLSVYTPDADAAKETQMRTSGRAVGDADAAQITQVSYLRQPATPPLMRDLAGRKDTRAAVERDAATLAATYGAELHP